LGKASLELGLPFGSIDLVGPYSTKGHPLGLYLTPEDQLDFFLCIFRTLPGLNFVEIENCGRQGCSGLSTFSGGTVFKLSTSIFCIFASFLSHFYQFFSLFVKGCGKKNHTGLYVGEQSENKCFHIFDLFPRPTSLGPGSQIQKDLFSDPSPTQIIL
jgi:hypothetical protein